MDEVKQVLICVTGQKTCERLINHGAEIAKDKGLGLTVLHVAKKGFNFLGNPEDGEALDYLFEISKNFNADMVVLRSDDVVKAIVKVAGLQKAEAVVIGSAPDNTDNSIMQGLQTNLKHVKIISV